MTAAVRLVKGEYGSPVDDAALAAMGLVIEGDMPDDSIPVWPENMRTVDVFVAMSTQWNVAGMGGMVGLRYEALPAVMRLVGVPPAERADVFAGLRVMERAALGALNG